MAFEITITEEAEGHLNDLPAKDQRSVESAIHRRLTNQPEKTTKAIKKLRQNPFAQYELRTGKFRVLYNVDTEKHEVTILLVGTSKATSSS